MSDITKNITIVKTENDVMEDITWLIGDNNVEVEIFGNAKKFHSSVVDKIVEASKVDNAGSKVCTVLMNVSLLGSSAKASIEKSSGVLVVSPVDSNKKIGRLVSYVNKLVGFKVVKYKIYESGVLIAFMGRKE